MSYPITALAGVDGEKAAALKSAGIRSTGKLLECARNVKGRKWLAEKTGIDAKQLLCWANSADRMRVKGVSQQYADLLRAAGVETVRDLKHRNAGKLACALAEANKKQKRVRLVPTETAVARWIDSAKKLSLMITY